MKEVIAVNALRTLDVNQSRIKSSLKEKKRERKKRKKGNKDKQSD